MAEGKSPAAGSSEGASEASRKTSLHRLRHLSPEIRKPPIIPHQPPTTIPIPCILHAPSPPRLLRFSRLYTLTISAFIPCDPRHAHPRPSAVHLRFLLFRSINHFPVRHPKRTSQKPKSRAERDHQSKAEMTGGKPPEVCASGTFPRSFSSAPTGEGSRVNLPRRAQSSPSLRKTQSPKSPKSPI
jgi:hypothetical protein